MDTSAWAIFYFTRWGGFMPSQTVYWPVPGLLINMSGRRIVQLKPLFISGALSGMVCSKITLATRRTQNGLIPFWFSKKRGLRRARS